MNTEQLVVGQYVATLVENLRQHGWTVTSATERCSSGPMRRYTCESPVRQVVYFDVSATPLQFVVFNNSGVKS